MSFDTMREPELRKAVADLHRRMAVVEQALKMPPLTAPKGWRPRGDGTQYWYDEKNILRRRDEVPESVISDSEESQ